MSGAGLSPTPLAARELRTLIIGYSRLNCISRLLVVILMSRNAQPKRSASVASIRLADGPSQEDVDHENPHHRQRSRAADRPRRLRAGDGPDRQPAEEAGDEFGHDGQA